MQKDMELGSLVQYIFNKLNENVRVYQILVDAKGFGVSWFGLLDIAIIGVLHIMDWSINEKVRVIQYINGCKVFGVSWFGLVDIALFG